MSIGRQNVGLRKHVLDVLDACADRGWVQARIDRYGDARFAKSNIEHPPNGEQSHDQENDRQNPLDQSTDTEMFFKKPKEFHRIIPLIFAAQ
jgi:hypothetical protein